MPPERVGEIWPVVSDHVMRAVIRGGNGSYGEIAGHVLAGRDLLWLVAENGILIGSVVTSVLRDAEDGRAICVITACAGPFVRARHLLAQLELWASAQGCHAMRIYGRKGWRRVLRDYRPFKEGIEKDLI